MNMVECLRYYTGHDVSVHLSVTEEIIDFSGKLTETGDDYLIIKTTKKRANSSQIDSAEQIISSGSVAFIIHFANCKKCRVEESTRKLEKIFEEN